MAQWMAQWMEACRPLAFSAAPAPSFRLAALARVLVNLVCSAALRGSADSLRRASQDAAEMARQFAAVCVSPSCQC
jgi:hypothetical protein